MVINFRIPVELYGRKIRLDFAPLRARRAARRSSWSDRYRVCDTKVTVI